MAGDDAERRHQGERGGDMQTVGRASLVTTLRVVTAAGRLAAASPRTLRVGSVVTESRQAQKDAERPRWLVTTRSVVTRERVEGDMQTVGR
ncbi:hypothetical protein, partial [Endothiovibrio diazotrophicus]